MKDAGLIAIAWDAATTSLTTTTWAPAPVPIVTLPVYVPGTRPAGNTETDRVDGVTALAGVTASQLPALDAEAAKPVGAADVTERACGARLALPCWNANESSVGAAVTACD